MARHAGSKNKCTIIKELRARGDQGDLEPMEYQQLVQRLERVQVETPAPPKEPDEHTVIEPEEARRLLAETRAKFKDMTDYYAPGYVDEGDFGEDCLVPERIQDYLRTKLFFAADMAEAEGIQRKAIDKEFMHLMVLWDRKRITGPNTPDNIAARARSVESWAKKLEKDGKKEDAARQYAKAEAIRATPTVNRLNLVVT